MSDNAEFTLVSDGGESSENKASVNPSNGSKPNEGEAVNDGSKGTAAEGVRDHREEKGDVTGSFKERLDRMRRRERERSDAAIKANNEAWEKRFKELEDKYNAFQKPNVLKREDFSSDEEFVNAKRKNAMEELVNALDKRNEEKARKESEEKAKQSEAEAYQRKFAERFNNSMKRTLSEEQQKQVLEIVNDEDSSVNMTLSSREGATFQKWIMEDSEIPADIILYLEQYPNKLELLTKLSPRKQVQQLDLLERHLVKAKIDAMQRGSNGGAANQNQPQRNVPVMGKFGGSTQAVTDNSQLSDQERVEKLIKAMRTR